MDEEGDARYPILLQFGACMLVAAIVGFAVLLFFFSGPKSSMEFKAFFACGCMGSALVGAALLVLSEFLDKKLGARQKTGSGSERLVSPAPSSDVELN